MFTKTILGITLAALIAVVGYALLSHSQSATVVQTPPLTTPPTPDPTPTPTPAPTPAPSGYSMNDVAKHNSASSCWAAINGKVYDLTSWINQHPGGPQHILPLCGTDGSAAFNNQHSGQARPAQELTNFYIGALAQ